MGNLESWDSLRGWQPRPKPSAERPHRGIPGRGFCRQLDCNRVAGVRCFFLSTCPTEHVKEIPWWPSQKRRPASEIITIKISPETGKSGTYWCNQHNQIDIKITAEKHPPFLGRVAAQSFLSGCFLLLLSIAIKKSSSWAVVVWIWVTTLCRVLCG